MARRRRVVRARSDLAAAAHACCGSRPSSRWPRSSRVLLARAAPADGVLLPALAGRDRHARRRSTTRSRSCSRASSRTTVDQRRSPIVFFAVLMVAVRRRADAASAIGVRRAQRRSRCATSRAARVDENQKLLQARGQVVGRVDGRPPDDRDLKATGAESDFFADWAGRYAKCDERRAGARRLHGVPARRCRRCSTALNTAAILGVGGLRVMDGHLTHRHARRVPEPDGELHRRRSTSWSSSAARCRRSRAT